MKIELYEVPRMMRANFSRPGGLMTVSYLPDEQVRVVQSMPNPASTNLPFIVISDATMPLATFNEFVKPIMDRVGEAKLVKTEEVA